MTLVMTLVVRDEADIIDEHLSYHLNAGVDFVIATDHRSQDGTTEILQGYSGAGVLRLIREDAEFVRQGHWQTRMARLAVLEHGADWVIPSDADEFWWARGGSLHGSLERVPAEYGLVKGIVQTFLPRRDDGGDVFERMTVRLAPRAPINDPATPFRPVVKVVHRAHSGVVVGKGGAHRVFGLPWRVLPGYPLEILHLPLRSREQCARKYRKTWTGWEENLRADLARARRASEEGSPDALWYRVALDDVELERGLAEGWLVSDTRLRDALGGMRGGRRLRSTLRSKGARLDALELDAAVFEEAELVRLTRWVDELGRRTRAVESRVSRPLRRMLSR